MARGPQRPGGGGGRLRGLGLCGGLPLAADAATARRRPQVGCCSLIRLQVLTLRLAKNLTSALFSAVLLELQKTGCGLYCNIVSAKAW